MGVYTPSITYEESSFLELAHTFVHEGKRMQMRQKRDKNHMVILAAYMLYKWMLTSLVVYLQVLYYTTCLSPQKS